jgi:hypothetical protein
MHVHQRTRTCTNCNVHTQPAVVQDSHACAQTTKARTASGFVIGFLMHAGSEQEKLAFS